jgi:hypothetical protein
MQEEKATPLPMCLRKRFTIDDLIRTLDGAWAAAANAAVYEGPNGEGDEARSITAKSIIGINPRRLWDTAIKMIYDDLPPIREQINRDMREMLGQ